MTSTEKPRSGNMSKNNDYEKGLGIKENPYRYRKEVTESIAQKKHKMINEKYLKNRESLASPMKAMVEELSEAEVDKLTDIKERQVICYSYRMM